MRLHTAAALCALLTCAEASAGLMLQTFDFRLASIQGFNTQGGYEMTADNGLKVNITATTASGNVSNFYRDPDGSGPRIVDTLLDLNDAGSVVERSAFTKPNVGSGGQVTFAFLTPVTLLSFEMSAFTGTCGLAFKMNVDGTTVDGADIAPDCNNSTATNLLQTRKNAVFNYSPSDFPNAKEITFEAPDQPFPFSLVKLTVEADAPASVPEPASIALLGLGIAGIAAARRRKQAA